MIKHAVVLFLHQVAHCAQMKRDQLLEIEIVHRGYLARALKTSMRLLYSSCRKRSSFSDRRGSPLTGRRVITPFEAITSTGKSQSNPAALTTSSGREMANRSS